ncbi:MAG: hypothetical protein EAY75_11145 [Bacteroidetes bacterium]|nr:MAG: hypothetical protein EAY75_11145 [Bacteroidota bacterium]
MQTLVVTQMHLYSYWALLILASPKLSCRPRRRFWSRVREALKNKARSTTIIISIGQASMAYLILYKLTLRIIQPQYLMM